MLNEFRFQAKSVLSSFVYFAILALLALSQSGSVQASNLPAVQVHASSQVDTTVLVPPAPIILSKAGDIRIIKEGSTATCAGDFGLQSPQNQVIFSDYLNVPNGTASPQMGPFSAGQQLVFYILVRGTYCSPNGPQQFLSTDGTHARVTLLDVDVWRIEWEDNLNDPNDPPGGDFNDLIVRVERIRGPTEPPLRPYYPLWANFGMPPYGGIGGEPVSTGSGNFYTQHRDLQVPGPGLAVDFTRAYNALDPRIRSFGLGWSFTYDIRAEARGDGSVIVIFADGRAGLYQPTGPCSYLRPKGFFAELSRCSGPLNLIDVDQTTFAFNNDGRLASITDPNSNRISLAYDTNGYTLTDTVGRTFRVNLNSDGFVREIIDPIGRSFTYDYNGNKLVSFHDAAGGTIAYSYTGDLMKSITDPNNHTFVTNSYDGVGRVVSQQDASGNTTTFEYQESPRRTTITDNLGNKTIHEFDSQDLLVKETDALGKLMLYAYDADFNRTYIKDRGGHETLMTYDNRGNMLTKTDALNQTATFTYDAMNNMTSGIDESGAPTTYTYDAKGNLIQIHNALGGDTLMSYDSRGLVVTLKNPSGYSTTFTYDAQGNLKTSKDALSKTTTYEYDAVGRRTAMTDANGHTVRFVYDANDRTVKITDAKGAATSFTYDQVGNLKSTTDRRGGKTTYDYNENDNLIKTTDARGFPSSFTYDKMYHRKTLVDRRGATTTYDYDPVYNLIQVTDAKGNPTGYVYDADRNLIKTTDALNQETSLERDPLHRATKMTNALGGVTLYTYDPVGRLVTLKDPKGGTTKYEYDALGRQTKSVDALGNATSSAYDPVGNLTARTNGRGAVTKYTYDAVNRKTKQIDPLNHTQQWEYDGVGNVTKLVDARGNATLFAYDVNDNVVQVNDALGGVARYAYDQEDNRVATTDQNGNTTQTAFDLGGNRTRVTLPMSQASAFEYDGNGNLTTATNAKGKTTRFGYDVLNLMTSRTDPLGFVTSNAYDKLRRLVKVTDANGNPTQYDYDAIDRLVQVVDALGGKTAYEYDPIGNLTAFTDANSQRTSFDVDLLGRVTGEKNPLGKAWQYQYDQVGNRIKRVDANGVTTQYSFDLDDRLTKTANPSGPATTFGYDENDNLIALSDATGSASMAYDKLNRLIQFKRAGGILSGKTLGYTFDPAGNRTRITYPDGTAVAYGYNANNWLTTVTDLQGGVSRYTYDAVGLATRIQNPNGTWADFAYDDADRLVRLFNGKPDTSSNVISSFDYTLDKVGNRVRTVEKDTRGQVVTWTKDYAYDKLYRLLKSTETPDFNPAQVLTSQFAYDAVGNRLSQITNIADTPNTPGLPSPVTTAYTYNGANQMLTAGAIKFTYDANGNRTAMAGPDQAANYAYDFENRLVSTRIYNVQNGIAVERATLDYKYDGLGRRLERGISDRGVRKTADYMYDALGYDLLAEYVEPGSPRPTFYIRDNSRILSRIEAKSNPGAKADQPFKIFLPNISSGQSTTPPPNGAAQQYFYHYDGLGSVSAWTNEAGKQVQEYAYASYGRLLDNNGPDNSSNQTDPHNSLTFSGKLWDQETELYYFGARDYDPRTGTWMTQDPYRGRPKDPMTLHRYGYVRNNPVNLADAYGFDSISDYLAQNPVSLSSDQISRLTQLNSCVVGPSGVVSASCLDEQTTTRLTLAGTQHTTLFKSLNGGTFGGYIDGCGNLRSGHKPQGIYIDSCGNLAGVDFPIMAAQQDTFFDRIRDWILDATQVPQSLDTLFRETGVAQWIFGKGLPGLYYLLNPARSPLEYTLMDINKAYAAAKVSNTLELVGKWAKVLDLALTPLRMAEYGEAAQNYESANLQYGEGNPLTESRKWIADYKWWSQFPFVGEGIAVVKSFFTPKPAY